MARRINFRVRLAPRYYHRLPGYRWRDLVNRGLLEVTEGRTARPRAGVSLFLTDGELMLKVDQPDEPIVRIKTSWAAIERAALYRVWGRWMSQSDLEAETQRHHTERGG